MNQESFPDNEHDEDEILDRVTQELREQPVPRMPDHLQEWTPEFGRVSPKKRATTSKHWKHIAIGVASVAALVAVCVLTWWMLLPTNPGNDIVERSSTETKIEQKKFLQDNVEVIEVSLVAKLTEMEQGLDEIDRELITLKQQAELLDVRRKADAMIEGMASNYSASSGFN